MRGEGGEGVRSQVSDGGTLSLLLIACIKFNNFEQVKFIVY